MFSSIVKERATLWSQFAVYIVMLFWRFAICSSWCMISGCMSYFSFWTIWIDMPNTSYNAIVGSICWTFIVNDWWKWVRRRLLQRMFFNFSKEVLAGNDFFFEKTLKGHIYFWDIVHNNWLQGNCWMFVGTYRHLENCFSLTSMLDYNVAKIASFVSK